MKTIGERNPMKTKRCTLTALLLLLASGAVAAEDVAATKALDAKDWTVPSVGMEMKRIPAGVLTMGSPEGEICRRDDEVQHKVTISKPFYMAAYECRQREFYKLMMPPDYKFERWTAFRGPLHEGTAFTYRFPSVKGGPASPLNLSYPMDTLSWHRAAEFCKKLTEVEKEAGRLPEGYVYRLPTEAEWEYACRAGSQGAYSFDGDYRDPAVIKRHTYAGHGGNYTFGVGDTVSGRKPNAWGLHDMHGNVWEWCLDWYAPYEKGDQVDPAGPATGEKKVARGGSCAPFFDDNEEFLDQAVHPYLRSAARACYEPDMNYLITMGFRVVLAPEVSAFVGTHHPPAMQTVDHAGTTARPVRPTGPRQGAKAGSTSCTKAASACLLLKRECVAERRATAEAREATTRTVLGEPMLWGPL